MRISVCMIAKNEAENLARSIESHRFQVDEVIVVDTGSTDGTPELAASLGARVFHFDWINDFAAARNYAIEQATGDWIISLDADEAFEEGAAASLRRHLEAADREPHVQGATFLLRNINEKGQMIDEVMLGRVFRNIPEIRFINPIHESLAYNGGPVSAIACRDVVVLHTGYQSSNMQKKLSRNLALLLQKVTDGSAGTMDYFYLTRETFGLRRYEESLKYLNAFFDQPGWQQTVVTSNLAYEIFAYRIQLAMQLPGRFSSEELLSYIRDAQTRYPDNPAFCYFEAAYWRLRDVQKAFAALTRAMQLSEKPTEKRYISIFPRYIGKTHYLLAECLFRARRFPEALEQLMLSLRHEKKNPQSLNLLLMIIRDQPAEEVLMLIQSFYDLLSGEDLDFLTTVTRKSGLGTVYLYFYAKLGADASRVDERLVTSLLLLGNHEKALELAIRSYEADGNGRLLLFAAAALLFADDRDAFESHRDRFSDEPLGLLSAWFDGTVIDSPTPGDLGFLSLVAGELLAGGVRESALALRRCYPADAYAVDLTLFTACAGLSDLDLNISRGDALLTALPEDKIPAEIIKPIAISHYMRGNWERAASLMERGAAAGWLDHELLIYSGLLSSLSPDAGAASTARRIVSRCSAVVEEYVGMEESLRLRRFREDPKLRSRLRHLREQEFLKQTKPAGENLPEAFWRRLLAFSEAMEAADCLTGAEQGLKRLLRNGQNPADCLRRLSALYRKVENPAMAACCDRAAAGFRQD